MDKPNRREFLGGMTAGVTGAMAGLPLLDAATTPAAKGEMPYRTLGRTGERVSLLGMGGWQFGRMASEEESTRFIRTGIDAGRHLNHSDASDGLAVINRPIDLRGTTVLGEQRGVQVHATESRHLQQCVAQNLPVRRDD